MLTVKSAMRIDSDEPLMDGVPAQEADFGIFHSRLSSVNPTDGWRSDGGCG
jgi:hypothetical protein